VAEGKRKVEELDAAVNGFVASSVSTKVGPSLADTFVSDDFEALYTHAIAEGGLNWRLASLNRSLGPIRPGDLGIVFGRPEVGKTSFMCSEVTFMAEQAKTPILYFGLEEQGSKVGIRLFQASLGAPLEQIVANKARATAAYHKKTNRLIKLVDNATITRNEIESYVREFKPCLVVVDQLDKVKGFTADREDLRLGAIYGWARELAKTHRTVVIGASQSDGSGEGIKYLGMGNVSNAKTSKQAEADFILGIGSAAKDSHPNIRGIAISKNKLLGGEMSVPEWRHAKFEVMMKPEIARFEDMDYG
jgi:replicative DNA helicase